MKPKDMFGLIVRLVGLIFLYESAEKVPFTLQVATSGFKSMSGTAFLQALFMVGWPLAVGYWMLRGAPPISRLAYPDEPK